MMKDTRRPLPVSGMTRVGQQSLRAHNLCLTFSHIANADLFHPPSRADIAEATGLTKATVSALVTKLLELELIEELPPPVKHGAGRPGVPLIVAPGKVVALGLEISVDFLGLRSIDLTGMTLTDCFSRVNLRQSDPRVAFATLIQQAYDLIRSLTNHHVRIIGACLALPGIADHPQGPLRMAPNLGWLDIDIKQMIANTITELASNLTDEAGNRRIINLMTELLVDNLLVGNEANLAARAEIQTSRDQSFIYVSGEIGIGAAIVMDGRVFSGLHGWAGEIGHIVVDHRGPTCGCGASGCLETYAGKHALMLRAGLTADEDIATLLQAYQLGDQKALDAINRAGQALGFALADSMNLIDVSRIVLGGSFAGLAGVLSEGLAAQITSRVLSYRWVGNDFEIRAASSGDYAAATGGALTTIDKIVNDPASSFWQR